MKTTVDDAIAAMERLEKLYGLGISVNCRTVMEFLTTVKAMTKPVELPSDYEGFIIEGAYQHGFEHIDDDAELLVVSAADLIKFVKLQRGVM